MIYLVPIRGLPEGARYSVVAWPCVLGREEGVEVRLDVRGVSRRHARLERRGAELWICDLGSRNGTRVNGVLIEAQALVAGDVVQIGRAELRIEEGTSASASASAVEEETTAGVTDDVQQVLARGPFDAQALSRRLVAFAQEWGPCAVEFRFRHGSSSHACWVATEVGRYVLGEFSQRLERVGRARGVNPSVTEVLFALARSAQLTEEGSWGWINGTSSGPGVGELRVWSSWEGVEGCPGWSTSTGPAWEGPTATPGLLEATQYHAMSLGPGRSYLFVAIPERAVRMTGTVGDIVVLHALWAEEGTYVFERSGGETTKAEFQRRVRDAATQFLIWTSVTFLNREARAERHWHRAVERADVLFNRSGGGPHDPAAWDEASWERWRAALMEVCEALASAVEELGGRLEWPQGELGAVSPGERWPLLVSKAASHRAVHPLVVASLLAGGAGEAAARAARMPCALIVRELREGGDLGLVRALVALVEAEGRHLRDVAITAEPDGVKVSFGVEVRGSREALAAAVLFRDASAGGKTTAAFAALRRWCQVVSVEAGLSEPDTLGVRLRWLSEVYSPPGGSAR